MLIAHSAAAEPVICEGTAAGVGPYGCVREIAGHTVLNLRGTDAQIGALYGRLKANELRGAYVPMMEGMYGDLPASFERMWRGYLGKFPRFLDDGMKERAQGLEGALGLPAGTIARFAWFTELGTVGPAIALATGGGVQLDGVTGGTVGGCTSFVAQDGETTVHARNVDYWGMGYWQPHATLVFVDPRTASGGRDGHRYAQLSDLGELWAGTTGVNERGLVVTTHLHVSRDVAPLDGALTLSSLGLFTRVKLSKPRAEVGVYRIVETMLRRAGSVAEAGLVARSMRPMGSWSFIVSDPSGARAVIDATPREVQVHVGESVATNLYVNKEMQARELIPSRGPVEGARLRLQRAQTLVAAHPEDMGVDDAIAILRDRYDVATGTVRAVSPNTVASADATQSVVIRTHVDRAPQLWVAVPHQDGYFPSPFADFIHVDFEAGFDVERCPAGCTSGDVRRYGGDARLDATLAGWVDAMRLQRDAHDLPGARSRLQTLDDPAAWLMAAWLGASVGDLAGAKKDLMRADALALAPAQRLIFGLLRGDLARAGGNEPAAVLAYQDTLGAFEADTGPNADLNAPMLSVLRARLAHPGRKVRFSAPDLKFQDVLGLVVR